MPICLYSWKCVRGSSTASLISCFWMSIPPMRGRERGKGGREGRGGRKGGEGERGKEGRGGRWREVYRQGGGDRRVRGKKRDSREE